MVGPREHLKFYDKFGDLITRKVRHIRPDSRARLSGVESGGWGGLRSGRGGGGGESDPVRISTRVLETIEKNVLLSRL